MDSRFNLFQPLGFVLCCCLLIVSLQGCVAGRGAHVQWDSESQILSSEASQVKLRSVQTRTYEDTDKTKILRAVVSVMQDLFFTIDILDEDLGVVSAKKLCDFETEWEKSTSRESGWEDHTTYFLYETDELLSFNINFRTWGPFDYRHDLARLTVTVRPKSETDFLVRASLQYNITAVETPKTYQQFFKLLNNAMFLANAM